jgi:hypothetical protein
VGTLDLFHEEDVRYARRLKQAGVDCELVVVPGAFHGFDILYPESEITKAFRDSLVIAVRNAMVNSTESELPGSAFERAIGSYVLTGVPSGTALRGWTESRVSHGCSPRPTMAKWKSARGFAANWADCGQAANGCFRDRAALDLSSVAACVVRLTSLVISSVRQQAL